MCRCVVRLIKFGFKKQISQTAKKLKRVYLPH